jgi:hypothetical protein
LAQQLERRRARHGGLLVRTAPQRTIVRFDYFMLSEPFYTIWRNE